MQQAPLLDAPSLSVSHAEPTSADRQSQRTGRFVQGSALPNISNHSDQCQPCHSSGAEHDACSAQDSNSASTSHSHREEVDMDTPSTPPGRGVPPPSTRPPDAPRKSMQARPPIQLSPNAPVRKLEFDSSFLCPQASSNSEHSCNSRHSGPGRG